MSSAKKFLLTFLSAIIQFSIALLGIALIFFLYYVHNWSFINASGPLGTDTLSAFTYVEWINRFFPSVPFWYPLQGAGVSFIASYPYLSHYLVVALHQVTNIPLIRAFNFIEFSAFLVTAVGIFIYCWTRLDYPENKVMRQIIGIVAASIYLIAPITYVYAMPWGFYAETVSYIFTAPTLILLDYFIDKHFKAEHDWKKRIAFLFGMLFYTLAFLTHFSTGVGLTHVILILIGGQWLFKIKSLGFKISLRRAIVSGVCIFLSLTGLFFWRYSNFQDYSAEVAKGGFAGYANPTIKLNDIDDKHKLRLTQVLGLDYYSKTDPRSNMNDWAMQPFVWIFVAIGGTLGVYRSRKMGLFGIMALYGLTTLCSAIIMFILSRIGPFAELLNARSVWTVYRMIVPILAAYGMYIACEIPFTILDILIKKTPNLIQFNWNNVIRPIIVTGLMAVITVYCIFINNHAQVEKDRDGTHIMRIGVQKISNTNLWKAIPDKYNVEIHDNEQNRDVTVNIDSTYTPENLYFICKQKPDSIAIVNEICDHALTEETNRIELLHQQDIQKIKNYCIDKKSQLSDFEFKFCNVVNSYPIAYQLNPSKWPLFNTSNDATANINAEKEFFSLIPNKPLETRYDLSGLAGSIIMRAPLLTNVSQTQVYINNLNLFSALWNYQSSVMYSDQPINQKPGVVSELAKYFGYEYIFQASNSLTAKALFDSDPLWETTDKPDWRHFKSPTTLTTWTNKPAVLFIGNEHIFLYDQFFKMANLGILPYDEATAFGGHQAVDDYSLAELSKFDVLYLEGYKYHDQGKAQEILDTYVKNGGNLFIDTGWRYESPDWEIKSAPPFFPTNNLQWKEAAPKSKMILDQANVIGLNEENTDIGFLTNFDSPWGLSVPQDIRDGSKVIVQSNNIPLIIAKTHGKGKVIWSGMNIISHIEGGKNENIKEIEVLKYALSWLTKKESTEIKDLPVSVKRGSPDKVEFKLEDDTSSTTTLYWRESYYPKWHAYLLSSSDKKELELYRAGPRLTGMRIPPVKANQRIILQIEPTMKEIILNSIAIFTLAYILLYAAGITNPIVQYIRYSVWNAKNKMREVKNENGTFKMHDNPESEE